jgi:DNA-binding NarL/FixJ family response regulator
VPVRVLLVDDRRAFLDSAARFLAQERGIDVVGRVEDAADALDLATRLRPDLALVDVALPGTTGFEVARRLKGLPHPPCMIVVTLHDSPQYRALAAKVADGFVAKDEFGSRMVPAIHALFPAAREVMHGR